jgi:hypothetical protein
MPAVAVGASIALFMLLAAAVTPDPPPGGVGLRGAVRPTLASAAVPGPGATPAVTACPAPSLVP